MKALPGHHYCERNVHFWCKGIRISGSDAGMWTSRLYGLICNRTTGLCWLWSENISPLSPGSKTYLTQIYANLIDGMPYSLFLLRLYNTQLYSTQFFNPLIAKLFNLNFQPLEVVSRWRDPQLQVSENYSDLTIWSSSCFPIFLLMSHFIFSMFNRWYLRC